MLSRRSLFPTPLRRRVAFVPLAIFVTFAIYTFWDLNNPLFGPDIISWSPVPASYQPPSLPRLTLPELDALWPPQPTENNEFCTKRFTSSYLEDLRDHAIQYCDLSNGKAPQSQLTCFHAHVRDDKNIDSFCYGSGATWDGGDKRFKLDCSNIRQPTANETASGLEPFSKITTSWFETGPKRVLNRFVTLSRDETVTSKGFTWTNRPTRKDSFVILVKREGNNNLWHSLMEIWSMMNSIDVLRMSRRPDGSTPLFQTPADMDNTYIVMLDDYVEESTFDLWRFFSRHPVIKLKDMIKDPLKVPPPLQSATANIIIPMAGASNPLWQNDWDVRDCRKAPLLELMVQRVFEHYQVPFHSGPRSIALDEKNDIVVTFIDRRGTRRLINHAELLQALQLRYPNVVVQAVDFATLSLPDQLRLVQSTDILVGVHGAGLTHTMFMRGNAGAVVEIQPENLGHKGFRNLAAMTGQKYYSAEAEIVPAEEVDVDGKAENEAQSREPKRVGKHNRAVRRNDPDKPWQSSHVKMDESRFLVLMDVAIKSLYNEGMRNHHVI